MIIIITINNITEINKDGIIIGEKMITSETLIVMTDIMVIIETIKEMEIMNGLEESATTTIPETGRMIEETEMDIEVVDEDEVEVEAVTTETPILIPVVGKETTTSPTTTTTPTIPPKETTLPTSTTLTIHLKLQLKSSIDLFYVDLISMFKLAHNYIYLIIIMILIKLKKILLIYWLLKLKKNIFFSMHLIL